MRCTAIWERRGALERELPPSKDAEKMTLSARARRRMPRTRRSPTGLPTQV
ncbi:MAG: hypothetical protein ACLUYK_01720 [Eggerthella lenta]